MTAGLTRQAPLEVAPETFLLRPVQSALGGVLTTSHNSLVIRGAEPVVVDTSMVTHRAQWFDDLFELVEPGDVRWLYLTHDDDDHAGNLVEALERCPNATVVTSWAGSGRMCAAFGISPDRVRTVDDGETFDVGDRALVALRPPVYDSAYTRGLFDPTTRVLHAADAFCTPMPATPVDFVDEIPARMWEEGMAMFHFASLCPWLWLVDEARFRPEVERLAALDADVIVSAHSPVIGKSSMARALALLVALPSTTPTRLSLEAGAELATSTPGEEAPAPS
jgi:flavorubredoxin